MLQKEECVARLRVGYIEYQCYSGVTKHRTASAPVPNMGLSGTKKDRIDVFSSVS